MTKKKNKTREKLRRLYYTPERPGSYGGVNALKRVTKIKTSTLKDWLSHQDAYTLHKPVRRSFPRRRVIVGGIDHQWQADLMDVQRLKKHNDGFGFILVVIDVLSKFVWALPLKNKTSSLMIEAFEDIFARGRKPLKLMTDNGAEFKNRAFQKFLKGEDVDFFTSQNEDTKASIAERVIRTLKDKLWRYFTKKNTLRYVEVLPRLVRSYNHTYHRSIKTAPVSVNTSNQEKVWQTLYDSHQPSNRIANPLKLGSRVRISKTRRPFKKGYMPSWTEELFTVSRVQNTTPVTYVLKDDHGEELEGTFYHQELQQVGEKEVFRIETILKQRPFAKGQTEYLVKWFGYPSSFNSWIPQGLLTQYAN